MTELKTAAHPVDVISLDARAALAALDEAWSYYTPETPVVLADDTTAVDGVLDYYQAA